jgi:hypothetical protein
MSNNGIISSNNGSYKQINADRIVVDLRTKQVMKFGDLNLMHGFRQASKEEIAAYEQEKSNSSVDLTKKTPTKQHRENTDSTASSENHSIVEKKSFWSKIVNKISNFINKLFTKKLDTNKEFKKMQENYQQDPKFLDKLFANKSKKLDN